MLEQLSSGDESSSTEVPTEVLNSVLGILLDFMKKQLLGNYSDLYNIVNENHFVNFTGATFALATYVLTLACILGSFTSTSLSRDMKIYFIANIL